MYSTELRTRAHRSGSQRFPCWCHRVLSYGQFCFFSTIPREVSWTHLPSSSHWLLPRLCWTSVHHHYLEKVIIWQIPCLQCWMQSLSLRGLLLRAMPKPLVEDFGIMSDTLSKAESMGENCIRWSSSDHHDDLRPKKHVPCFWRYMIGRSVRHSEGRFR